MRSFNRNPAAPAVQHRELAAGPIVWLGILTATCLLLVISQYVLWLVVPVMIAIVAYYMLSPLVDSGIRRGMTRARAVLIVTILLTVVLVLLGLVITPKVSRTVHNLPDTVASYTKTANSLIANARRTLSHKVPFLITPPPPPGGTSVLSAPANGLPPATPAPAAPQGEIVTNVSDLQAKYSGDVLMEAARWVPSILLVPFITYFLLLDGPRFKRFIVQAIPNAFFEKTLYLFYRVENQLRAYFQGLMALTFLDALCLGMGLWFFGLNEPFLLAAVAAVMAWVPYLGSIGGGLLVVLVAAHDFPNLPWLPYWVVGLFICVRMLDDVVFLPLTVGRSLHVHPLVTMLMFLLGGAVAGFAGLLLVMPVLGVVMVAGQIIGELLTDERILARHRHALMLRRKRARADLFEGWDAGHGL
ncbi:MAG TPA: AI-2E family transporter [Candidatus Methylacidiphilales bacterium]|nr:AI-2E family transporter [Candidatus Methylacidiphilales bacterium]